MMTRSIIALALLIASTATAEELSVDEIIAKHLEARGGYEKIKAIQTLVYSGGQYREGDFTGSGKAFMAFKRPWYRVVGNPEEPSVSIMEGYDGSSWEYYAKPGVVLRTVGHAAGATRRGSYLDGHLVDYREKGITVTRGKNAHTLIVTLPDGFVHEIELDPKTFLMVAGRYQAPFHAFGAPVKTFTQYTDYRPVAGVLFAFHIREIDSESGGMLSEMKWSKIEANRELPQFWFSPPPLARSRVRTLVDHLYQQRTDAAAVMWSYEQFRRTYPDADTREAIEFIGYQILKMGDHQTAIALLEANVRDYPAAASATAALERARKSLKP